MVYETEQETMVDVTEDIAPFGYKIEEETDQETMVYETQQEAMVDEAIVGGYTEEELRAAGKLPPHARGK